MIPKLHRKSTTHTAIPKNRNRSPVIGSGSGARDPEREEPFPEEVLRPDADPDLPDAVLPDVFPADADLPEVFLADVDFLAVVFLVLLVVII